LKEREKGKDTVLAGQITVGKQSRWGEQVEKEEDKGLKTKKEQVSERRTKF